MPIATQERLDCDREALRQRVSGRYATVCNTVTIGALRLEFTSIADPDDMARHMPCREGSQDGPGWQPYWAANWDASWAVAHVLLDEPLENRDVLDLGCGLGLTGAIAAARGARVWMVDAAQPALLFARLNTWPWRERVHVRRLDWRRERLAGRRFDLILGSDIIYDSEDWPYLERFWTAHLAAEGRVLLGESGRRTGAVFPGWLAKRGWHVERSEARVAQCDRALRLIQAVPRREPK
ncbi:MAG: protein N-lysine methyltransferase family protein [Planctomycetes bacterium]|nr:protein N-lysine methyltransferase family protein [Planctomycetota bacterium]